MTTEQNVSIVRRVFAALNDYDLDGVTSYYTPGCRFNGWAPQTLEVSAYKETMLGLLRAFPDAHFSVDDIIAEGDRVVVRHTLRGTQQDAFQGIPATGKEVSVSAIVILRMENGKASELWLNADFMGLMQQLGAVPA